MTCSGELYIVESIAGRETAVVELLGLMNSISQKKFLNLDYRTGT